MSLAAWAVWWRGYDSGFIFPCQFFLSFLLVASFTRILASHASHRKARTRRARLRSFCVEAVRDTHELPVLPLTASKAIPKMFPSVCQDVHTRMSALPCESIQRFEVNIWRYMNSPCDA